MKRPDSEAERTALRDAIHGAYMEIFPSASIEAQLDVLEPGAYIAITCSPTRGVDATIEMTARLRARGFRIVPHVAARSVRDPAHLRGIVERLRALGIRSLFVPGGDASPPVGRYTTAIELLRDLADLDHGIREIGIASHPEGIAGIDDDVLLAALLEKQAYANYLVSQMCFDAGKLAAWVRSIRAAGITLPIWLGIPGVVERSTLVKTSLRIGVGESVRFLTRNLRMAARFMSSAVYEPDELVLPLAPLHADPAMLIAGYHIFSFNQVAKSEAWRHAALAALGPSGGTE